MKKNIIKTVMIAVVAIFTGYNVYQSNMNTEEMSDVMLANVEALAQNEESGEVIVSCSASCRDGIGKCWTTSSTDERYCERSDDPNNSCSCSHLPG